MRNPKDLQLSGHIALAIACARFVARGNQVSEFAVKDRRELDECVEQQALPAAFQVGDRCARDRRI
jgi:hypothetical protein